MDLSNDLISKFVKITNDGNKKETKEGIVYGTAVEYDGAIYVKIDGSDLLTPIDTTADIKEGERVTIMIKNHNAIVTGNITSPSASSEDVKKVTKNVEEIEGEITEFEAIIADVVHVGELDAEVARIDELIAGKATIEDLTATNTEITNLKAKDAEIENLVAEKATIEDLTATNTEITNLKAKDAEIENLIADIATVENLEAINADIVNLKAKDAEIENLIADIATVENLTATNARIDSLEANKADINYVDANFATIDELEATHAEIEILDAEVADINTLVNGNLTSDNILSFNITSQNTTMENAFVKDAMIDTVTANKIMSGTIDTNNVTIQSADGSMLLQGTLLQMKDDNGKVRIQIGKDTGGNFTFILYDESGTGILIDEEGIKSSDAIGDGLIVDAKIADNANIAGSKLDIASVITEVNNDNSTTIKSNKIYLNEQGQSLEVAFNSLKTQVETIQDVTIDGDLSSIVDQIQSNTTQIEVNKEGISTLVAENTIRKEEIQNLDGEIESVNNTLSSKYSSLEQDVSGFKTTVADTYATKQSVTDVSNNLSTNYSTTSAMNSAISQKANEITSSVSETYATKQTVTDLSTNLSTNYSTTTDMNSAIKQSASNITSSVSETYQTKSDMSDYPTTTQMNSAISQSATDITSTVSSNYATKSALSTVEQTANKISWIIASGNSSSTMTLTDKVYTLVSENINLTADHIDLHGYITANSGFSIDTEGNMTATNANITGTITATSGKIANFTISGNDLIGSSVGMGGANETNCAFWAGSNTSSSAPFRVGHDGTLVATNANITGNITATSGKIANFTISGNDLIGSNVGMGGASGTNQAFWAGSNTSAFAPFIVGHDGALTATNAIITGNVTATSGKIANFTISGNDLIGSSVGMGGASGTNQAFWAGSNTSSSAPFRVGHDGALVATNANITGTVNATAGTFSGNIVTNNIVKAYNSVYAGAEVWGGFALDSSGSYVSSQTFTVHSSEALQIDGNPTRISSVTGEVEIGDSSSYNNLRAKEIYAQEIVYTDDLRTRSASQLSLSNVSMRSENAFIEFSSGYGVIRVPDATHLYLQTGGGAANTSSEVRCTAYKDGSTYVNLRAYNLCAQNAVYANGVNVSSDRDRKRDIELYTMDALNEICTTPVYTYHLDTDLDEEVKRIGIIMQEAPLDAVDISGKGVDLYQMATMLWKAIQQQQEMIEELKEQLKGE